MRRIPLATGPVSSPRVRRYFRYRVPAATRVGLFSARAEVFPMPVPKGFVVTSLLRACGGISTYPRCVAPACCSSPRVRRYFHGDHGRGAVYGLFSARAEVFPSVVRYARGRATLLRACGGISLVACCKSCHLNSSPRVRRYFPYRDRSISTSPLFSARAEVFPRGSRSRRGLRSLLRACGGISVCCALRTRQGYSSPRVRRYFLGRVL